MKRFIQIAAVFALLLPLAYAQQSRVSREGNNWAQEITGSLSGARNLHVRLDAGSVNVIGGSQQNITYVIHNRSFSSSEDSARREFDSYKINTYVRGDTAWITGEWEGGRSHRFSGQFTINVPRNLESLKLETDGGSVSTKSIAGEVNAQTGGGSITLDDIGGSVNAETGGDFIDVGTIGGDARLQTGGGKITVRAVRGKLDASTGGGDMVILSGLRSAVLEAGGGNIQVKQIDGNLKVSTGGGNIDLGEIGGLAEIQTGGGSIRLTSAKGAVRAETGAGRIELNGVPSARAETGAGGIVARFVASNAPRSDSTLETSAGDVTVYMDPSIKISVRASIDLANGHTIHTDFSDIHVRTEGGDYGPRTMTADGALNGGGPVLKVSTTTGDIYFRRSK
jgi:DUF4097 and DUF4098 domain-containing protein YvlB